MATSTHILTPQEEISNQGNFPRSPRVRSLIDSKKRLARTTAKGTGAGSTARPSPRSPTSGLFRASRSISGSVLFVAKSLT